VKAGTSADVTLLSRPTNLSSRRPSQKMPLVVETQDSDALSPTTKKRALSTDSADGLHTATEEGVLDSREQSKEHKENSKKRKRKKRKLSVVEEASSKVPSTSRSQLLNGAPFAVRRATSLEPAALTSRPVVASVKLKPQIREILEGQSSHLDSSDEINSLKQQLATRAEVL
jgi:hypothetical protein